MDIPAKILWSLSLVCGVEIDASRLVVGFFAEFSCSSRFFSKFNEAILKSRLFFFERYWNSFLEGKSEHFYEII